MSYKQLKWFILLIPTFTVGLWEYIRHEYLLPYISMDLGNWLTPVIVLFVTFTLLTRFFTKLEVMQEQLRNEREEKAVLEERERIAADLHDGMAQSLFLLSIKVNQLDKLRVHEEDKEKLDELQQSIADIHEYVRTGITNLRESDNTDLSSLDVINTHINKFENDTNIEVIKSIDLNETLLTLEEKTGLISFISEALINIQKHAEATTVVIEIKISNHERYLLIKDNGIGFDLKKVLSENHFGIKMMYERCDKIDWQMKISQNDGWSELYFKPKKKNERDT